MKSDMILSVIEQPMDHFTTEDDAFLRKLLDAKKKGEGYKTALLRDDMQEVCRDVMEHWYNIKGKDYENYFQRFFADKWKLHDTSSQGQLEYDEAMKFIRDFGGAVITL